MRPPDWAEAPARAVGGEVADVNARRAVESPADGALLAIRGRAASGKTETLARRYVDLLARDPALAIGATIVTAPGAESAAALGLRIEALLPTARRTEFAASRYIGQTLERLAIDMLAANTTLSGLAYDLELINVYDAQEIFERAIAPLFSADWNDYLGPDIDPEIPGLRAPDRFAVAVLRLIRKLRDAQITPAAFLSAALHGATEFYANPPNLSAPALLLATKDEHRSALAVDAAERERQRRREIDLAKLIAKLYDSYLAELVAHGCLTASDAIAEATRLLSEHPALARTYRRQFRIAIVDDAHDLPTGAFRLLQAIFGKTGAGITVAGDPDAATYTFAGARPERIFGAAVTTITLQANYRVPAQIVAVARAVLEPGSTRSIPGGDAVRLHRSATPQAEATFVADTIATHIAAGIPPARIAVLHRSLRALGVYEDALIDRNIPIALHGDGALFARQDALDALALLWSAVDPFAHTWLVRVLQLPLLHLSDATIALLCGEPTSPQAPLFDLPVGDDAGSSRRWDRRRDLRLGTNVVRGDRDADLDPAARLRLRAFRERRARWQDYARTADTLAAVKTIVTDGGTFERRPGETPARARRRATIVQSLLAAIGRYSERYRGADLAGALNYCERIARSESGPLLSAAVGAGVVVAAIDQMKARRFEHVFVVDVRAGSFPPYYVPDAFLFSPTYGMIPKDSVGEAVTARTAKFTWYAHHAKLRENYAREDRRALAVALERADRSVTVSAAGRPTRGLAAPELLVELGGLAPPLACVEQAGTGLALDDAPSYTASAARFEPADGTACDVRFVSIERVAQMVRCVVCAPRRAMAAALADSFSLLPGRLGSTAPHVLERDVQFAFPLESAVVFGHVPALVEHDAAVYVAVARKDYDVAALTMYGLHARVNCDAFFIETVDGEFDGPHTITCDASALSIARARAAVNGHNRPLCAEHRDD